MTFGTFFASVSGDTRPAGVGLQVLAVVVLVVVAVCVRGSRGR